MGGYTKKRGDKGFKEEVSRAVLEAFYGPEFESATGVDKVWGYDSDRNKFTNWINDLKTNPFLPPLVEYCMEQFIATGKPPREFILLYLLGPTHKGCNIETPYYLELTHESQTKPQADL